MHKQVLAIVLFAIPVSVSLVRAQIAGAQDNRDSTQFRGRAQPSSGARQSSANDSISRDLLAVYQQTQTAATELAVTEIARACAKVVPDQARSKADRDYAASLLAWALNRRGEMRSERAAELVEAGKLADADKLDLQAAKDFETAIEYGPANWRTHHNLAISLAMRNEYTAAIAEFDRAIGLKPDYANAHFNRAELQFELEQYELAIEGYTRAIDIADRDPQYFNSRGHCKFLLEQYDAALADYREAARLGKDSAVYHTDLADALQYVGRWEESALAYRAAVAANGQYPRAYQNAAWLMATCPQPEIRDPALALSAAKKAIELGNERSPKSLDTLAAAEAATGDLKSAIAVQQEAIRLSSDDQEKRELAGRLTLYRQGKVYRQQVPASQIAESVAPPSDVNSNRIRTASGAKERNSR